MFYGSKNKIKLFIENKIKLGNSVFDSLFLNIVVM